MPDHAPKSAITPLKARITSVDPRALAGIVFILSLVATLWSWQLARRAAELRLETEFQVHVRDTIGRIEQRMLAYEQVLQGIRGLHSAYGGFSRRQFREYVESLELEERYPGLQALGYAPLIGDAERPAHVESLRAEGFPEYAIFPGGRRERYAPIVMIEPFRGMNLRGLGFDPLSEPRRRDAMDSARLAGAARISGKVRLVLENDEGVQSGVVMYLPVLAATNKEVRGWAFAAFRMNDLMRGIGGEREAEFGLAIFDGRAADRDSLLYASPAVESDATLPNLVAEREMWIAGRTWTLVLKARPAFAERADAGRADLFLAGGLLVSLLLAVLACVLANGRSRALAHAQRMTIEMRESEQRWRFALEGAGDGVFDWALGGERIVLSERAREILGLDRQQESFTFADWKALVDLRDRERLLVRLHASRLNQAGHHADEHRIRRPDGAERWVLFRWIVIATPDAPARLIGTLADITERHRTEASRRLAERVLETMGEAIMVTDTESTVVSVNPAFTRITGYEPHEILGKTPRILNSRRHHRAFFEEMWQNLLAHGEWAGETWNRRKSGEVFPEWQRISCVRDTQGRATHYVSVFSDLSEIRRIQAEAEQKSWRDPLTGLPNRALFLRTLEQSISNAWRDGRFADVLLLDLDRFKEINEARGIATGDGLLRLVGERLMDSLRSQDIVARLDSDEFAILLPRLAATRAEAGRAALTTAEKLRLALREPLPLGDEVFRFECSIGVALFPDSPEETASDVLGQADTAMHQAKVQGGARTVFYESEMGASVRDRFLLERELRAGIGRGELRFFLQPQVDGDGCPVGAEALVRWQHPQRGLVPPGLFIPLAEESGLIVELDLWMLKEVCRALTCIDASGRSLRLSVNVSPRTFQSEQFCDAVMACLAETGADPSHLVLEITEGIMLGEADAVIDKMTRLSELGIHFSMDDFGTGYSSLSYLKRLPIHELKIDRSFVQDAPDDPNDAALVETILSVANHLGLRVVAEGVETGAQADFLRARGEIIQQGYLHGRPQPGAQWLAAIRQRDSDTERNGELAPH